MADPIVLTSGNSETDATSYATASITPGENKLILAVINTVRFAVATSEVPTLSGCGLTWEVVRAQSYDNAGSDRAGCTMFRAMKGVTTTGVLTFQFANQHLRASWIIMEIDNADQSGVNGAGAIVQSAGSRFDDGGGETSAPSVALNPFAKPENYTLGYTAWGFPTVTVTPGADDFIELAETSPANGTGSQTQWKGREDTVVDWTFSGSVECGNIAIEIKRNDDIKETLPTGAS